MRLLPMGPLAVLVDELDDPASWAAAFRKVRVAGVVDVVPAARTVLIIAADESSLVTTCSVVPQVSAGDGPVHAVEEVLLEVVYDGPDLEAVADLAGLSIDQVVDLHSAADYRVDFCGFAPGFAYLSGVPTPLQLPRRSTPRTRVPAGSVAIAAGYAAVYPTESPGGWHLIGSTEVALFDVDRDPPAMLMPGTPVKFVPA